MISPTWLSESTATRSSVSPVDVAPVLGAGSPDGAGDGSPLLEGGEPTPACGVGAIRSRTCDRMDFLGPFIIGQPMCQGFNAGANGNPGPFAHANAHARRGHSVPKTTQCA